MVDPVTASNEAAFFFGSFRLLPSRHLLLDGETPVHLGSRAFAILVALVERCGELVSKDALIARAWPTTYVAEANLKLQVASLRRALGDGRAGNRFIGNVPGRGYRFLAAVSVSKATPAFRKDRASSNLPIRLDRIIGRDELMDHIVDVLPKHRFLSIIGSGGVGKTTVAIAAAAKSIASYQDGVKFVDLGVLSDASTIAGSISSSLEIDINPDCSASDLALMLREKHMLIVLDCCEHIIQGIATFVIEILKNAPYVALLTTSREPLRVIGEHVIRLPPLGVPPTSAVLTSADALGYSAVQLFVERVASSIGDFVLTDGDALAVSDICRKLDGIALAIELAAGRVYTFGIRGLATLLDDRLLALKNGMRVTLPRHKTLSAMLDWSYERLNSSEKALLAAFAVFVGPFTLDAACAVAGGTGMSRSEVVVSIESLTAKSLISANIRGLDVRYRLLDTTRVYAKEKLIDGGSAEEFMRLHAEYYHATFERASAEWETTGTAEWVARYGSELDNLRAAISWALSSAGDAAIGVSLTVACVPLLFQLSLLDECLARVDQALSRLQPDDPDFTRLRMKLMAASAVALTHKKGPGPKVVATWTDVLAAADSLDESDYRLRALWGLWVANINAGRYRVALDYAQRFLGVAELSPDRSEKPVGDRLMGNTLYYLGDNDGASRHLSQMLLEYVPPPSRSHVVRYQFDQLMAARIIVARIDWAQGRYDEAIAIAQAGVDGALASEHPLSICVSLALGLCQVSLFVGDLDRASRSIGQLLEYSTRHSLSYWQAWSYAYQGVLLHKRGDEALGLQKLGDALDEHVAGNSFARNHLPFLAEYAEGLARNGNIGKATSTIDAALERCAKDEANWFLAELLRVKGDIVLRNGTADAVSAGKHLFEQSIRHAQEQNAISWELRTTLSLASLLLAQGFRSDVREMVRKVYDRFHFSLETRDSIRAKSLLETLN